VAETKGKGVHRPFSPFDDEKLTANMEDVLLSELFPFYAAFKRR